MDPPSGRSTSVQGSHTQNFFNRLIVDGITRPSADAPSASVAAAVSIPDVPATVPDTEPDEAALDATKAESTSKKRHRYTDEEKTWISAQHSSHMGQLHDVKLQRSPGSKTYSHTVWLAAWSPPTPQLLVYAASCSGSCTMLRPDASQNKRGRNAESDARLNSCVAARNERGWLMSFTRNMLSFTVILLSSRAQCTLVSFVRPNRVGSSLDHMIHFHSQPAPQNHRKKR